MRRHRERIRRICFWGLLLLFLVDISNCFFFFPSFELKQFFVQGQSKSFNSSENASILFRIYLSNTMVNTKVFTDSINLTFYDGPSQNNSIANFIVPKFYIGRGKEVHYSGMANAIGLDLDDANLEISAHGFKVFRLRLETSVRYEYYWFCKTRRYGYRKGAIAKITGETAILVKHFIRIFFLRKNMGLVHIELLFFFKLEH